MSLPETLLPKASLAVFVLNDATRTAADTLSEDWRFSRITTEVATGGLAAAIAHYESAESPDILVVQTDRLDDDFEAQLETLANECRAETKAVIIGPENDIALYRRLKDMGVSDYLVHPIDDNDLKTVVARILSEALGTAESRFVAILGAKGGVGTSHVAQILALQMARCAGENVAFFDAAGGRGLNTLLFGYDPVMSLMDAAQTAQTKDPQALLDLLQDVPDSSLKVLAIGGDPALSPLLDPAGFEALVQKLMTLQPFVVCDLSDSSPLLYQPAVTLAQHIVIVTTPFLPSLRNARAMLNEIKELRDETAPISLIVSQQGRAPGIEVKAAEIEQALGQAPLLTLPYDPKVFAEAENSTTLVPNFKSGGKFADLMTPLLKEIGLTVAAEETKTEKGFLGKILKSK